MDMRGSFPTVVAIHVVPLSSRSLVIVGFKSIVC